MASEIKSFPTKADAAKYVSLIKKRVKFNKEVRFDINSRNPLYFGDQKYKDYKYKDYKYKDYNISIIDVSKKSITDLRKVVSGIKNLKMYVRYFTEMYAMDTPMAKKYFTKVCKGNEYTAYIFKTK